MSSHHIVREKQEPALLALGLGHLSDDEFGQLLEWSPTLIATPPVAEQLTVYGIKIDAVIAEDKSDLSQGDVKLIQPNGASWLEAGINYLIAQGYPAVNIVTDEFELSAYETYASQINLVIFYNGKKIYPIASGFRKWKPAHEQIGILNAVGSLKTEGLTPTGEGNYVTQADGFFSLGFDGIYLFIAEDH